MAKTTNLYAIFDKIAGSVIYITDATNDGMCVRTQSPNLAKNVPLGDVQIYKVGSINVDTMEVIPCAPVAVSWDSYKFPENPLAPKTIVKKEVEANE